MRLQSDRRLVGKRHRPSIRADQADQGAEEGRLPGAVWADQADDLPRRHGEGYVGQGLEVAEPLRNTTHIQDGHANTPASFAKSELNIVTKPRGRHRMTTIRIRPKINWERPATLAENQSFISSS